MERKRKGLYRMLFFFCALAAMLVLQNGRIRKVEAATEKFTIKDGILEQYQGTQKNVVIPDGVKEIKERAFYGNKYIEIVSMPDSVEILGKKAFMNCENLKSVTFSDKIEKIPFEAFSGCGKLQRISLPSKLKRIDARAFCYVGLYNRRNGFSLKIIHLQKQ